VERRGWGASTMEGSVGSAISTAVRKVEGREKRQIKQWLKGRGGRVLDRKVLVRTRGMRTRVLRVYIEGI